MTPAPAESGELVVDTTCAVFIRTADRQPDAVALRTLDGFEMTWGQARDRVFGLAATLAQLGLEHGDTVAVLLINRPEFLLFDLATIVAGGTPMSIYQTSPPGEIAYLLDDAKVKVVVTEPRFEPLLEEALRAAEVKPTVLVLDEQIGVGLDAFDTGPGAFDARRAAAAVAAEDIAVIVYTSGTTGPPKGVQLSHRNLSGTWRAVSTYDPRVPRFERILSYLPAAHIADRVWGYLVALHTGATITYVPDPKTLFAALAAVRPSMFLGVPRIWEKLRAVLQTGAPAGASVSDPDTAADMRRRAGLSAETLAMTGAAPVDTDILDFFAALGAPLLEVYGMTETSGMISGNRAGRSKPGSVGHPFTGADVRLSDDGEILVRSDALLMAGYRNLPEKTAETIREDGWLYTGDIGRMDDDGMITIIGRKKDIIITAGGKNISPANIEDSIRSATQLAGPVLVVGDRRAYIGAIVSLEHEEIRLWAERENVRYSELAELAANPKLREHLTRAVAQVNRTLSRPAQVKRFVIVGEQWDPESGCVTPTMKIKRRVATERYAAQIDDLYDLSKPALTPADE